MKTKTLPTEAAPVAITAAANADYSSHFTSANASYEIRNSGSGNEQVVQLYRPHSHVWDTTTWQTDATHHWHNCTATGCTVTENSEKNGYAAHIPVAIGTAVAATCNTDSTTAGSKCSVCGYVLEAQTEIPAISYNYGAWTITAEPTLTTEGAATQVCANDSTHKSTVTLPVLTDTSVWTEGAYTPPTEDADGSQGYTSEYGTVTVAIPATGSATPPADPTYAISGTVTDSADTAVSGAVVKLMQGNMQIGTSVTTDASGNYSFTGVAPGLYNVVATKDSITKTILVEITSQNAANQNVKMPDGEKNSVVEVKDNTPAVVVGGVDEIADNETVSSGETVTVKLTVETKAESAAEGASAIKQTAIGKTLEYIDLTLTRQINSGESANIGGDNTQLLTIVIPFTKGDKGNITVYRYHGDKAETLPTAASSDGEYFTVGGTAITIYAKRFYTYAIGYSTSGGSDNPDDPGDT